MCGSRKACFSYTWSISVPQAQALSFAKDTLKQEICVTLKLGNFNEPCALEKYCPQIHVIFIIPVLRKSARSMQELCNILNHICRFQYKRFSLNSWSIEWVFWFTHFKHSNTFWTQYNFNYSHPAFTSSFFSLTIKCLQGRLVAFFEGSFTKADTFRSWDGVFFSEIV